MAQHGKNYRDSLAQFDKENPYPADEALALVKAMARAKFDETVEASFHLNIDPTDAEQIVRGTVALPAGTGQTVKIAVFAPADKHAEATEAGAELVGGEELVAELQGGRALDFDLAIATPDMMAHVGRLGRVLGPRGLMPNPKAGTVTPDVAKAVGEFKGGRIEYRNDRFGNVQAPVGKASFEAESLLENYVALVDELVRVKPAKTKGHYFNNITVSSTMGPGVKVELPALAVTA